jgi:flagellar biosynthetic protein FliR
VTTPAAYLNATSPEAIVLFACRVGGLLLVAPVFSSRTVPAVLRACLIVLFTWLLAPVAITAGAQPSLDFRSAMTETLVGFALGLGAAVFTGAAEAMGELLAISSGLSGASALDPLTNVSAPVLGQFTNLFAVALLLSVDAHHLMLEALAESARLVPIGAAVDAQAGLARTIGLGSGLFLLGLRFAAPVVAVVLLGNVALAILTRVAPQLNVLSVAFPLQIGLGLFALAASVPLVGAFFGGFGGSYAATVLDLLGAFGAGGR